MAVSSKEFMGIDILCVLGNGGERILTPFLDY